MYSMWILKKYFPSAMRTFNFNLINNLKVDITLAQKDWNNYDLNDILTLSTYFITNIGKESIIRPSVFLISGSTNSKYFQTICIWAFTLVFFCGCGSYFIQGNFHMYAAAFCSRNSEKTFYPSASHPSLAGCHKGIIMPDFWNQKWIRFDCSICLVSSFPPFCHTTSAKPCSLVWKGIG